MIFTQKQNLRHHSIDADPAGMALSHYINELWQQTEKVRQNP
ncbi:hypothetical protein [Alteromonas lipolytica]|nr:hypothetical protein [Alteromonas lipolytica]